MMGNVELLRSLYQDDRVASGYIDERFSKPLGRFQHQIQVRLINNAIRLFQSDYVLEVACGPARLTPEITGFTKGVAIDSSHQMLEIARRRVKYHEKWRFVQADAFKPCIKQRFQLIFSFRFIRHLKSSDRIKVYKTCHKLLENRGIAIFDAVHYDKIVFVRNMENRGKKIIYDKIYPDSKTLENEMDEAGFQILRLKGLIHHFYLQAIISRISNKLKKDNMGIKIIQALERYPFGRPLEWIVICRKRYP